jgi:hypothetical protein
MSRVNVFVTVLDRDFPIDQLWQRVALNNERIMTRVILVSLGVAVLQTPLRGLMTPSLYRTHVECMCAYTNYIPSSVAKERTFSLFQDGVLLAMLGALPNRGCWSGQVANLE